MGFGPFSHLKLKSLASARNGQKQEEALQPLSLNFILTCFQGKSGILFCCKIPVSLEKCRKIVLDREKKNIDLKGAYAK